MTIYEVIGDYHGLNQLIDEMIDEETGETREFTEEEKTEFKKWVEEWKDNFDGKFDAICKARKNMQASADVARAEYDALRAEQERLSRRAKSRENAAERVKNLLWWALDVLNMKKYKTDLFSAGVQNTRKCPKTTFDFNPLEIPTEYLKMELSSSAVQEAIKEGHLYEKEDPLLRTKLFYKNESGEEQELKGVAYLGGQSLVIR